MQLRGCGASSSLTGGHSSASGLGATSPKRQPCSARTHTHTHLPLFFYSDKQTTQGQVRGNLSDARWGWGTFRGDDWSVICTNAESQHPIHTQTHAHTHTHYWSSATACSCIDGKQSKVAHGQPAGNYSTSHHIPEHTWRPHTPSHESIVHADGVASNSTAFPPTFFFFFFFFFFFLEVCSHHSLRRCAAAAAAAAASAGIDSAHTATVKVPSFCGDQDDGCGLTPIYSCKYGGRARFSIPNASASPVCCKVSLSRVRTSGGKWEERSILTHACRDGEWNAWLFFFSPPTSPAPHGRAAIPAFDGKKPSPAN